MRRVFIVFRLCTFLSLYPAAVAAAAGTTQELKLQLRDGQPFRLESMKGKVVVLDFWAPWC